tara:strand:+ start:2527 stop:3198 length:672 start_codon:yes stop_codon:yes gene_type:complete
MLVFSAGEHEFTVPEEWSEITLEKYAVFIDAVNELQKKLKEDDNEDIGFYQIVLEYREYFNKLFHTFTGIEPSIIDRIKADNIYTTYMYIMNFLKEPEYNKIDSFTFKKKKYYLPKSKVDYFGNEIEMAEASFGEVVEAMQIQEMDKSFQENNFKVLPYQIAMLCRRKGEDYNDQIVKERAEVFKDLPMDVVWQVAFFLIRQKQKSLKRLLQSLEEARAVKTD